MCSLTVLTNTCVKSESRSRNRRTQIAGTQKTCPSMRETRYAGLRANGRPLRCDLVKMQFATGNHIRGHLDSYPEEDNPPAADLLPETGHGLIAPIALQVGSGARGEGALQSSLPRWVMSCCAPQILAEGRKSRGPCHSRYRQRLHRVL